MRLAIGDIHGRSFWKHYLDEDYTEYYILGDYFDSFDIPFNVQLRNFLEITEAARQDARIKLCWGNHDFHYFLRDPRERYSGYQKAHAQKIYEELDCGKSLLNIVYKTEDNILISHAGVSATFLRETGLASPEQINAAFEKNPAIARFNGTEPYGDEVQQGPLWIRPRSLISDALKGCSQIAGHTVLRKITTVDLSGQDGKGVPLTITFIDTHDTESIYRF